VKGNTHYYFQHGNNGYKNDQKGDQVSDTGVQVASKSILAIGKPGKACTEKKREKKNNVKEHKTYKYKYEYIKAIHIQITH
jgi:hypothetical protein